ncbi:MAG: hypothetical protein WC455_12370 [Dehalococcoidia bacterium]|jgi:hypothetical protein
MNLNGYEYFPVDPKSQPISHAAGYKYWFYGFRGNQIFALHKAHLHHEINRDKQAAQKAGDLAQDAASDGFETKKPNIVEV